MTIVLRVIPSVGFGETIALAGVETGEIHDTIPRDRLDSMDQWAFQESLQFRDQLIGYSGVKESLKLVVVPVEEHTSH